MKNTVYLLEFKDLVRSEKARAKALGNLRKFLRRQFGRFSLAIDWKSYLWKLTIYQEVVVKTLLGALKRFVLVDPVRV